MESVQKLNDTVNKYMNPLQTNTILRALLHLMIVIYAAKFAPSLPPQVVQVFQNKYVQIALFAVIMWTVHTSPSTAILLAIAFMVTMNYVNQKPLWEFLDNVTAAPSAPSVDTAIATVTQALAEQQATPQTVATVSEKTNAVVITPQIVQTESGPTVVTPNVVIAPSVVSTPQGTPVVVKPNVTVVGGDTTPLFTANVPPEVVETTPVTTVSSDSGCFPARKFDISKILAYNVVDDVATV